ncbi:hypothetical protein R1flu_018672 [Riccia fluitans]|uniref:Uncharacterized protein n=1 Tax=Riccia fluitans TaxID=41844 RepID=A0ABD1ZK08_9MARC
MSSALQMPAQRPNTAYSGLTGNTQADPAKQALKSVFSVCTSLAQALSDVRAQLFGAGDGGGGPLSKDRDPNRQQTMRQATHHYEQPIGRFKSPQRQQPGEAQTPPSRERWLSRVDGIGNAHTRTVRQSYENSADQLQHFQERTDNMYRAFRNRRAEPQANRRPVESSHGPWQPARGENERNDDTRNIQVSRPEGSNQTYFGASLSENHHNRETKRCSRSRTEHELYQFSEKKTVYWGGLRGSPKDRNYTFTGRPSLS